MTSELTPIRKQYLDIKKQYQKEIVFFRLGDFYETFDQDAEIASKELDIVLTSRNVAKGSRVPMAGIPYHAVDNYLAKLIDKGYHVAICEQVGKQPKKGLVPRKVVRVVTPGTIIEPELLHDHQNNFLASYFAAENHCGIAYVDITTGEFRVTEIKSTKSLVAVKDELNRINAAEVLYNESTDPLIDEKSHFTPVPEWMFELRNCEERLKKQFKVATLDGFGLRGRNLAIRAAGALLHYLDQNQASAVSLLKHLNLYHSDDFMVLDSVTFRNLELTETIRHGKKQGSLLSVIDKTVTPMGERTIRKWLSQPLLKIDTIEERQSGVSFFYQNGMLRAEIRKLFRQLSDLERLTNRIISGSATPRELVSVRDFLENVPHITGILSEKKPPGIVKSVGNIDTCQDVLSLINAAIVEEPPTNRQKIGIIRSGYSDDLDQVINSSSHARNWIKNLESIERERTGIKNLKVGYNKVFGYYIEISRSNTTRAPEEYIRKQTLVNAERYITPELKEYEALVLNAEERIHEIELRLFRQVCELIAEHGPKLIETARNIGVLDVLAALAETASVNDYVRPEVVDERTIEIIDGRHPVVEHLLHNKRFVSNDTIIENDEIIRIITGPNMSGKSTFLRQVALIVLLSQIGSFVPAKSARIGLADRIFTRIGAQDEIHAGQSTFMVEMIETANILNNATGRSLLILDEIGRGTSTYDGVSIAWAVVEYIHNHPGLRSRTLFATHYHELMQLSAVLPGVRNYNVAVSESEENVVFLHKIVPGGSDRSYGIHVGDLAGLPQPVVRRAAEILKNLEATSGEAILTHGHSAMQMDLFPETNPILEEIDRLDLNALTPIQAINILYEWKSKFSQKNENAS